MTFEEMVEQKRCGVCRHWRTPDTCCCPYPHRSIFSTSWPGHSYAQRCTCSHYDHFELDPQRALRHALEDANGEQ